MGFTNDEMTAHGFRAMARSLLAEGGGSRTPSSDSYRTRPPDRSAQPTTARHIWMSEGR